MASGVEELLDMLFEMIDEAKNLPLSNDKCVIERDRALDLIDDIRSQFPVELTEAKKLMANRAELIASTKREAESIRKAAGTRPASCGPRTPSPSRPDRRPTRWSSRRRSAAVS